jgi:hypothetical protein
VPFNDPVEYKELLREVEEVLVVVEKVLVVGKV